MVHRIQQLDFVTTAVAMAIAAMGGLCFPTEVAALQTTDAEAVTTEAVDGKLDDDPLGLRKLPVEGQDIGVDAKLGAMIDGNLTFSDSQNQLVRIADLFDGTRPVMLSFNYSDCPKLCSVQLENMTMALRDVDFEIGKDFDFVSVSIDPNEQIFRARESKEKYLHLYNRPDSSLGWHFLTGEVKNIANLTNQCGFRYKYIREQKLYSHPPVFILISPQGKIVRYIHGLSYDPDTIRLALIESAAGKIGSPINILSYGLGCFSFDESTGKYTFQAIAIMRIGGVVTIIALLFGLTPYWFYRRQANNHQDEINSVGKPTTA